MQSAGPYPQVSLGWTSEFVFLTSVQVPEAAGLGTMLYTVGKESVEVGFPVTCS